ncbi:helix-turn-helix domain-containing GNAT family N-acetyltransferase [Aurantimonas sp. HBX-1]|uniref:bifunctional helix-turn-helix transcriptional regulator/GNAT family N-acetyltransferase n=1 Tax=Aurantimonas sp. HBX-1 TaxID=2906072 RepID=UPI001F1A12F9|nr:helix-turn-helix domain-containing GNAT family N-acetyltransferase [Aurantimonas sp. HBX-1]UIJ73550.1 helix-turn-helix domain-containing GNAT family N-acetyltransferase [Aurantimonas sp. HBX-1]
MALSDEIAAVRDFNRFYTRQIGLLEEGLLKTPYTLGQARLIYEIATRTSAAAIDLARSLDMDQGLLSRMLKALEGQGLVVRSPSSHDQRRSVLGLTDKGAEVFAELDAASAEAVAAWLAPLAQEDRQRLVAAMKELRRLIEGRRTAPVLRDPAVGDLAWVTHRQAVLYASEYGFDWTYEALVARIVSDFASHFDAQRERCWIAEQDGAIVGSVFVVRQSDSVAKLRLLYVEPSARGQGLGANLVGRAVGFAADAGYSDITLWTNSVLVAARRLYEAAGFSLVGEEPHHSFGCDLVGQTWNKRLAD